MRAYYAAGRSLQASIAFPSLSALDWGRPCSMRDSAILVRDRRLGVRRVGRVLQDVANEIERGVKRLVVVRIRRNIGLRAGLLVAFGLQVSAQRSLTARVGARLELLGTSCSTSMSGGIPVAWIERPDGVK